MNMMPQPQGMMGAPMQMPSPEMLEQAKLIAEAVAWEEVEPILRTDERRNYNIDIQTDSTVFEDAEAEKQQRIEVMGAMTQWMERALPAIQANRSLAPLMKELTMFTLGAFKIGRTLEETFEDAFDQIQNAEPQPDPETQKLEMEAKAKEAEFAQKSKDREADMMFKQQEHQLKLQGQQADLAFKEQELGLKQREVEFNHYFQQENAKQDQAYRQEEMGFKREEAEYNRQAQTEERNFSRAAMVEDAMGKREERSAKLGDMQERLAIDKDEQKARREMEGEQLRGQGGKTAKDQVNEQIQTLASQFAQSMESLAQNQVEIVSALQEIKGSQDEMADAMTAVVGHMTAPRKVKRDDKGRAVGVEMGKSDGDLRSMLASLKSSNGRGIVRDKMGRVEAIG